MSSSVTPASVSAVRFCAHCDYDLAAHAPGARCPECGAVVPEHELILIGWSPLGRSDNLAFAIGFIAGLLAVIHGTVGLLVPRASGLLISPMIAGPISAIAFGTWAYLRSKHRTGRPDADFTAPVSRRRLHLRPDGYILRTALGNTRRHRWAFGDSVRIHPHKNAPDQCIVIVGSFPRFHGLTLDTPFAQADPLADQIRTALAPPNAPRPPPSQSPTPSLRPRPQGPQTKEDLTPPLPPKDAGAEASDGLRNTSHLDSPT